MLVGIGCVKGKVGLTDVLLACSSADRLEAMLLRVECWVGGVMGE